VALEDIDYRVFASRKECPNTFEAMAHPPLVPYAIAAIAAATGGLHERSLHFGFLVFALVAAAAMYDLGRRFTARPLEAALLLVSAPIFLLSAGSLMTDMPALALSLGGLALFVRGVDAARRAEVGAAGILIGLATLTRYSTLIVIPLLVAYALAKGRWRAALPALGAAGLVFASWAAQNLAVHGALHVVTSARHYQLFFEGQSFDALALVRKTLGDATALGGTAFAGAGLLLLTRARRRLQVFGLAGLAAFVVYLLAPKGIERLATYRGPEILAVCACFAAGVLLVVEALGSDRQQGAAAGSPQDALFLRLWLALSLLAAILVLPFGAARYVLPALPPLVLLLVRRWQGFLAAGGRARPVVALIAFQGLGLGGVLGLADAELADRYRRVALQLRQDHPGRRLWFVGEWGFRYYMGTVGGLYLRSTDESPGVGDLIVRPVIAGMHEVSPGVKRRAVLLQEIPLQSRWPLRLMSFDAKAGYYSHHWGYLPWAPSRAPLETIEIFEVRSPAPPASPDPCASS
jgi:4-amino-4-deoxy-L-arabinose transferase-like glycosyltransferase